jgi:hypothetical protein
MNTSSTSSLSSSSPYSSSSNPLSSSSSIQLGGKGYRHKKNCKCRLCKKGGENTESSSYSDLEMGPSPLTESSSSSSMYDKMEKGQLTNYSPDAYEKVGGKRRRKSRKQRKSRKSRKSRKTKKRRSHK